ncbi:MAG: single-stranded DNA-binding protein [Candidatus Omnitrophica bacterium]|nr:single-stranded DNA-binding protein [Candidatus Omnitrophota bacterium]
MSIEINSIVIGGNLTRDVVVKDIGSGRSVATFTVASNRTYIMNGEKKQEVAFIDVDVWGPMGQNCAKYLHKGSPVVVVGRIKQDTWQAQDGSKRSKLKVLASNVQFLSAGSSGQQGSSTPETDVDSTDFSWEE